MQSTISKIMNRNVPTKISIQNKWKDHEFLFARVTSEVEFYPDPKSPCPCQYEKKNEFVNLAAGL